MTRSDDVLACELAAWLVLACESPTAALVASLGLEAELVAAAIAGEDRADMARRRAAARGRLTPTPFDYRVPVRDDEVLS